MDGHQFDRLTQGFSQTPTRRRFGALFAALGLAVGFGVAPEPLEAKKKKKKKKQPKKCQTGAVTCGAACVDTRTNAQHCGGCGQPCGAGQSCVAGACQGGAGGCTSGRDQCGTACVDLDSDEQHCGACDRACAGDLTCLSGVCGCAAGTTCGSACVDTQSDRRNCGACGVTCASDETCSGGQCIVAVGYPCNDVYDCGGEFRGVVCRGGQCACDNPAEGLCIDPRQSSYAICRVCCPGGNRICPGDQECSGPSSPTAVCTCPSGTEQCRDRPSSQRCTRSRANDPKRCGDSCIECTLQNTGARCCAGTCIIGGFPGGSEISDERNICGSDCTACSPGTICCNGGPATPAECVLPKPGTSVCPDGA